MNKKLQELSLEEYGALFPIEMKEYDPNWPSVFEHEKKLIVNLLGRETVSRIEHFGSTSITNIKAKDSVDILIEIPNELLFNPNIIEKMEHLEYTFFRQAGFGIDYMIFVKGFHTDGKKAQKFFVHMTIVRDFLNGNCVAREEYEKLKCSLAKEHSKNRIEYRIGKSDFVKRITDEAKMASL